MAEIIKVYKQSIPAVRFVGKKYGDEDRVDGGFGVRWGECFENGLIEAVEKLVGEGIQDYQDNDAYLGLMRWKEGEPFEYWIGMFVPENTPVPDEFEYVDFPQSELGVCWVYGNEGDVYCKEHECAAKLEEAGYQVRADDKGAYWFFERYVCPRFTTPDDLGKILLDICHFI